MTNECTCGGWPTEDELDDMERRFTSEHAHNKGAKHMQISQQGIDFIKRQEGTGPRDPAGNFMPYKDQKGLWTIGYGHLIGHALSGWGNISPLEAEKFLESDLNEAESSVNCILLKTGLSQNRYDALVSFVFNVGTGHFLGSHLREYLMAGDFGVASQEFTKWVYAGDRVDLGLQMRRAREKRLFDSGDYGN